MQKCWLNAIVFTKINNTIDSKENKFEDHITRDPEKLSRYDLVFPSFQPNLQVHHSGRNMDDQLQKQTSALYKFITNLSTAKNPSEQQQLQNNADQLTIILNGETILAPPSLTLTNLNNMTANLTTTGDGVVQHVPNDATPPR